VIQFIEFEAHPLSQFSHTLSLTLSSMADQNQKAEIFELNNGTVQLLVTNLGCTITSFSVPGKDGSFLFSLIFQFFPFFFDIAMNSIDGFFSNMKVYCPMLFLALILLNPIRYEIDPKKKI
jgi:hypothetical protein